MIYKPKAKTITMKHIKLYEEFVNEAAEPKFVVHKGAAVMGYASSKVQARQNAKTQGAEYSTVEDYKEQYGDKFITEAAEPNIPKSEWEESNQRAENGPWVCAKWKGKYYCAVGIMWPNGDLDYVEDVEEIDKGEYDSLMK